MSLSQTPFTSPAEFQQAYQTLFQAFSTGRTKDIAWRKWQLKQVWWMIDENEDAIIAALRSDLNRHEFESQATDIMGMRKDLMDTLENLDKWVADDKPEAGFLMGTIGKARVRKEPLGVALIIGAWNFPILLIVQPMVAAIAAGNCVMVKPSELSVASQNLLVELIPKYLDQSAIKVVTGGPQETSEILKHRFNHIFFTGSNKIARYITAAAAKHLTPTVLELGGQGPAIVTAKADIDIAAKRVAYAKYVNAGQICLSVNHVFVDPAVHDEFVQKLGVWFDRFLDNSRNIVRIVNERNWDRVVGLLERTSGKMVYGGERDRADKYIKPCVVIDMKSGDSLLSEELFGPIVPVFKMDYKQACKTISSMEHPLAIYVFSNDQNEIDEVISTTNSGGVTVNDVMIHATVPNAPFGGVGESGYGYYHGKYGFLAFSHLRTIVDPPLWLDKIMGFRYPPFDVKHTPKVAVKNRLGFKKGETLEDQRTGHSCIVRWFKKVAKVVAVATVVTAFLERQRIMQGEGMAVLNEYEQRLRGLTG